MFFLRNNQPLFDMDNPILDWHFPNNPILPGAIQCSIVSLYSKNKEIQFDVKFRKMVDGRAIAGIELVYGEDGIQLIDRLNDNLYTEFTYKLNNTKGTLVDSIITNWVPQGCDRNRDLIYHEYIFEIGQQVHTTLDLSLLCESRKLSGSVPELVFIMIETMGNLALEKSKFSDLIFYKFDDVFMDLSKISSNIRIVTKIIHQSSILTWCSEAYNVNNELVVKIGKATSVNRPRDIL